MARAQRERKSALTSTFMFPFAAPAKGGRFTFITFHLFSILVNFVLKSQVGESMTEEGGHDLSASGAGEKKHLLHKSERESESGNN